MAEKSDHQKWEERCEKCGVCCRAAVTVGERQVVVRELDCKNLADDLTCKVYETRFVEAPWCMHASSALKVRGLRAGCPYEQEGQPTGKEILSDKEYDELFPQIAEAVLAVASPPLFFTWSRFFRDAKKRDPRWKWRLWTAATGTHGKVSRELALLERARRAFTKEQR